MDMRYRDDDIDMTSFRCVMMAPKLNDVLNREGATKVEAMASLIWLLGFSSIPENCHDPLRRMDNAEEREALAMVKTVYEMLKQIIRDHQQAAIQHRPSQH